jgi:predicted metal-dependent hydrolase
LYVGGETHLYLGRQYRLKVEIGTIESVKLQGRFITVICTKPERVQELLETWYRDHAEERFNEFCLVWIEKFSQFDVSPTEIQIRKMTKRWGSCTPGGKIILNTELIKAPRGCIEYVILHELCHLIHYNHDKKFFELQTRLMPTWQKWKERLENLPAISGSFN